MEWQIEGVTREALVFIPAGAKTAATPVIFSFHGHGGTAKHTAAMFDYQSLMPEAISVYMQGLPCPSLTDPEGTQDGWQRAAGELDDRDLKFFDAVLATLKKDFKIDPKRIYCTGYSNGGFFTYVLWGARGDIFAAVAPVSGVAPRSLKGFKPLPALHIAGEKDEVVSFKNQSRSMEAVRELNGCDPEGKPWARSGTLAGTVYTSKSQTPFVAVLYPGKHKFPEEAPELVVKFFKEHAKE